MPSYPSLYLTTVQWRPTPVINQLGWHGTTAHLAPKLSKANGYFPFSFTHTAGVVLHQCQEQLHLRQSQKAMAPMQPMQGCSQHQKRRFCFVKLRGIATNSIQFCTLLQSFAYDLQVSACLSNNAVIHHIISSWFTPFRCVGAGSKSIVSHWPSLSPPWVTCWVRHPANNLELDFGVFRLGSAVSFAADGLTRFPFTSSIWIQLSCWNIRPPDFEVNLLGLHKWWCQIFIDIPLA